MKKETYDKAVKIARPVVRKVDQLKSEHFSSDCPMAGAHIANLAATGEKPEHPMSLLRKAYGI